MAEINLYQYPISPFSEKVRRVLAYKRLQWNPIDCHYEDKSNLLAVTGGKWTRVPVLEWHGEVVFNSADIIRWLERKVPVPSVIPDDASGLIGIIDHWADNTLFMPVLYLVIPDLLDGANDAKLKANREKLIGMTTEQMRKRHDECRAQLRSYCAMIDSQLKGADFFLGHRFTMADASLYHPFFFLALNGPGFAVIDEFPHLKRWYLRVRDLG
jgi:glutathione S-transferase